MSWCTVVGDPHVRTFTDLQCTIHGIGVFPILETFQTDSEPDAIRVQSFHCPGNSTFYGSSITGLAVQVGGDKIEIIDGVLHVNDVLWLEEDSGSVGAVAIRKEMDTWYTLYEVIVGGLRLVATSYPSENVPTGYYQEARVEVLDRGADIGSGLGMCAASDVGDQDIVTIPCSTADIESGTCLFSEASVTTMSQACAFADDAALIRYENVVHGMNDICQMA